MLRCVQGLVNWIFCRRCRLIKLGVMNICCFAVSEAKSIVLKRYNSTSVGFLCSLSFKFILSIENLFMMPNQTLYCRAWENLFRTRLAFYLLTTIISFYHVIIIITKDLLRRSSLADFAYPFGFLSRAIEHFGLSQYLGKNILIYCLHSH